MTGVVTAEPGSAVLTVMSGKLVRVELIKKDLPAAPLEPYTTQFEQYFQGQRTTIDLQYSIDGTEFQKLVFSIVQRIPYGATLTYSEIAEKTGSRNAARAVGNVLGKNPLHIIIPCHRVVASDGIGGFCPAAGTGWKSYLINLEKRVIDDQGEKI